MKCLNCGKENKNVLCDQCRNNDIINKIYNEILNFASNLRIENQNIYEYASELEKKGDIKNLIPDLITIGREDGIDMDFYECHYLKIIKNPNFIDMAEKYLNCNDIKKVKSQQILYDIISYYFRDNFVEPTKWCDLIYNTDDLCIELYNIAADYYSMIAEYEKATNINEKYYNYMLNEKDNYFFSNRQNMKISYERIKKSIDRYKNEKPYWPSTIERKMALIPIYEEKGIEYPKFERDGVIYGSIGKVKYESKRVKESDFVPIKEFYGELPSEYVIFECSYVLNLKNVKVVYEIAALQIKNNEIINEFQSYICPWDGKNIKESIAKRKNIDLDMLDKADDVKTVTKKFLNFISDNVLVNTEALSNQASALTRVFRYSGYSEIKNSFIDVLDIASSVDKNFDLENNNRKFLLEFFNIREGENSIEKAKATFKIIECLKNYKELKNGIN